MKKLLSFILFIFTTLILISCNQRTNNISITCEQIEKVYLEEGYYVFHQEHNEEYNNCYLVIKKNENSEETIYFHIYDTIEEAQKAQEDSKWNIVLWFYSSIQGETRWKQSKCYNNIHYEYFDSTLTKPFDDLINNLKV